MRVHAQHLTRWDRTERGATALLVGALALTLVALASFTVDFGVAYASKRQLQTAADAGVLAGGAVYAVETGTCDELTESDPTSPNYARAEDLRTQAEAETLEIIEQNRPGAEPTDFGVSCNDRGQIVVSVRAAGKTGAALGAVLGVTAITTQRSAAATVAPATSARGVKPYAICSSDTPVGPFPSAVREISVPGSAHSGSLCPEAETGGNWWYVDCPEDVGDGSVPTVAENLEEGCSDDISIVPHQPNPATPAELSDHLTNGSSGPPAAPDCNDSSDYSSSCLSGDTGNSSLKTKQVYEIWPKLLGTTIMLPVFCSTPGCDPDTVNVTGTNTTYPVHKLAAVVVCGFHIYDKVTDRTDEGECAGSTYDDEYFLDHFGPAGKGEKDEVYLYLKFTKVLTSGDTTETLCGFGDPCDSGPRRILLTE